ncbi:MAG: hypothetical protein ABWY93_28840 [Mycobacterium sp.]
MGSPRTLDTRESTAWMRRFARTTPGVVGIVAVTVATLCVVTGVVAGAELDGRIAKSQAVLDRSEPLAYAAQNLYAALSAADAVAAAEFLSGNDSSAVRVRYQQALADAAAALTDVTSGAPDPATRQAAADLTAQLAAYTGLVESARANNRQGFVVGGGYLREASSLMQTTMLPGAERIFTRDLATLDADQRAVGSTPVVSVVLTGVSLAAVGIASVVVFRRSNRQFNIGLVIAAATVVLAGAWMLVATGAAAGAIADSRRQATSFQQLAEARIAAQQARTDETLELIARGDITAGEQAFTDHLEELTVTDAVTAWQVSHRKQVQFYENSDYNAAVAQAIGPDPTASTAQFAAVETSLRDQIEQSRAAVREQVSVAGTWLAWSPTGTLVLMTAAAAATVVGLWPRLKEFL